MTLATAEWIKALSLSIPLVIVFGIFVVRPVMGRRFMHARYQQSREQFEKINVAQTRILDELQSIRSRLDGVEQTLSSVD